jgi:hypothetical protein
MEFSRMAKPSRSNQQSVADLAKVSFTPQVRRNPQPVKGSKPRNHSKLKIPLGNYRPWETAQSVAMGL